jgi:citrate lyase acyl carrier protein
MKKSAITGNKGERIRSDCQVRLQVRDKGGLEIKLQSKVERMFGEQIMQQAREVLDSLGIKHARLEIEDTGALPFVIGARIEAAACDRTEQLQELQGTVPLLPTLSSGEYPQHDAQRGDPSTRWHYSGS